MQEQNKQRALKYLTYRMRSEFEMREYLREKEVEEQEIDEIIAYLYSYKYLNDQEFAESFIRDRCSFHPCGRYKIMNDLRQKGVDDFVIEDALLECFSEEQELEQLQEAYEKYSRKRKSKEQIIRYLYSKGYSIELVYKVVGYDD